MLLVDENLTEKPSHRLFRAPANLDNTTSAARHLVLHPLPRVAAKQVHTQEYSPVPTRPLQNVNIIASSPPAPDRRGTRADRSQGAAGAQSMGRAAPRLQRISGGAIEVLLVLQCGLDLVTRQEGVHLQYLRGRASGGKFLDGSRRNPRASDNGLTVNDLSIDLDMIEEFRRHQDGVCAPLEPHEGVAKERVCYSLERRASAGEPLRFHRCPSTRLRDIDALSVDPHTNFSPRGAGRPNHVKQRRSGIAPHPLWERHGCGADGEDGYTRGPQASSRRGTPRVRAPTSRREGVMMPAFTQYRRVDSGTRVRRQASAGP